MSLYVYPRKQHSLVILLDFLTSRYLCLGVVFPVPTFHGKFVAAPQFSQVFVPWFGTANYFSECALFVRITMASATV